MIESVVELIKMHEGYRQHPYRCPAGALSIGYGRNLDSVGIDRDEAEHLMARDVSRALQELRMEPYWLDLSEVRQAVLIDMVYNLGWPRFSKFRKFRDALARGDYRAAADEMVDSHWYRQVGNRSKRLVGMMDSGQWPKA